MLSPEGAKAVRDFAVLHDAAGRQLSETDVAEIVRLLAVFDDQQRRWPIPQLWDAPELSVFLAAPGVELVHVVRLFVLFGWFDDRRFVPHTAVWFDRFQLCKTCDLEDVAQALKSAGLPERMLHDAIFGPWNWPFFEWGRGRYYEAHPDYLVEVLNGEGRMSALKIASEMTSTAELHEPLWEIALSAAGAARELAQTALCRAPGLEARIVAALGSRKFVVRASAATWIADIGGSPDAIEAALKKEKHDTARAALLDALERLGVSIEQYVNSATLIEEANAGLKRGVPTQLSWFPFDQLPTTEIPQAVLTWFVVSAFKLKKPTPSAMLRRYVGDLSPPVREQLGTAVAAAWIARDTAEGSAMKEKGVLAVAAACGGGGVANLATTYINRWYGWRASQCKALLQVLSWIEHPSAVQSLLAIATRFRTRGIQKAAMTQVQQLAARTGWTVSELADRTVPTAGLDDQGRLSLDCGDRVFVARLDEQLKFALQCDGRAYKGLPAKALEAKKTLSVAKKTVKAVLKAQKERLYEAMCEQRVWKSDDWLQLALHPLVSRQCARLVWCSGGITFRPLGDGSLTDANDNEVRIDGDVKIAHAQTVAEPEAWLDHFADYEVAPLFSQFECEPVGIDDPTAETNDDFAGYVIGAFALRNAARRFGYERGSSEDGGWFFNYRKAFAGVGIEAVIGFTGNRLPEDNRDVALLELVFERNERPLMVKDVPIVLLAECRNDLRRIAGSGRGFQDDWKQIAGY